MAGIHSNANKKAKRYVAFAFTMAFALGALPLHRLATARALRRFSPHPGRTFLLCSFEVVRKRLRVEKRKAAGTVAKHRRAVSQVAASARTGKAARRAERVERRETKAALVRLVCVAATLVLVCA